MRQRVEYFVIGTLAGLAIGLVIGMLFAPASGANTRRRLADEALKAADAARGVAERAEQAAEALGGRVEHYLGHDEELAWRQVREIRQGVQRYTQSQESS